MIKVARKTKTRDPTQAAMRPKEKTESESEELLMGLKPKVEGDMSQVVEESPSSLRETGENPLEMGEIPVEKEEKEEMGELCLAEAHEIRVMRTKRAEKEERMELLIIFWLKSLFVELVVWLWMRRRSGGLFDEV